MSGLRHGTTQRWGLFRLPDDLKPGELTRVRAGEPLPLDWRGCVAIFDTREEASEAWIEGHFIREVAE